MIKQTRDLLLTLQYHGIFGIEWLRERQTGHFYLIDFNARPFSSIGHLRDCGVNLPMMGYRNLLGDDLFGERLIPDLKHRYWVDLLRDSQSRRSAGGRQTTWVVIRSLLSARSFAYWDWRDPGPALQKTCELIWFFMHQIKNFIKKWGYSVQLKWNHPTSPLHQNSCEDEPDAEHKL